MYHKILVALDHSPADARFAFRRKSRNWPRCSESELLLLHVADGWAARCFDQLKLAESEEIKSDRAYLEKTAAGLRKKQLTVTTLLAMGNPPTEILKIAEAQHCNLIAMTSHGHRFFGDLFHGSTITQVRHHTRIPLLIVRAEKGMTRCWVRHSARRRVNPSTARPNGADCPHRLRRTEPGRRRPPRVPARQR